MELFGIGMGELFLLLVLALVVIGPERLPEVAGQMGRTVADLRRQVTELTSEFQRSLEVATEERKAQRVAASVPLSGPLCPRCGVRGVEGAQFCSSCGASLTQGVADGERGE